MPFVIYKEKNQNNLDSVYTFKNFITCNILSHRISNHSKQQCDTLYWFLCLKSLTYKQDTQTYLSFCTQVV